MNCKYIIKSPCKINLHLDVHSKRGDGYHNLTSIFQLISLEDEIIAKINSDGVITVQGDFDCKTEDNLIYRAADEFIKRAGLKVGFHFIVRKNIPSGGGVGGGSSNCGSILRFLNYLYPEALSRKEIFNLALSLGSDVPFFLKYPTALVEGRGELIEPLKTFNDYFILICNPSIHISTKLAFSKLKDKGVISVQNADKTQKVVDKYLKGVNNFTFFKNSFEIALYTDYNFINDIKTTMMNEGAIYSALSGSGSTMFGVFTDKLAAIKTSKILSENSNYKIDIVRPLDKFPEIIKEEI